MTTAAYPTPGPVAPGARPNPGSRHLAGGEPPDGGRAEAAAAVDDPAIDAALDAMVDAAPPLDEPVRRRLSQLLRQHPDSPSRRPRHSQRGHLEPSRGITGRRADQAEGPYAADADNEVAS